MILKDWIKNKLRENSYDKSKVYDMFDEFLKETDSNVVEKECYKRYVRVCYNELLKDQEIDLSESLVKLEAQNQKKADINNQLRKSNRENYRLYNSLKESYDTYVECLKSIDLSKIKIEKHKSDKKRNKCGILHLTDWHMNELINPNESFGNEFNFEILSKRAKKFVVESMKEFDANNVSDVYILMTGDMFNSSRRLSEKIAMCSSLTMASLLLIYILEQIIIELTQKYNVHISFCVGNESRIEQDLMESQSMLASSNYDFLLFHSLRIIFRNKPVEFIVPKNLIHSVVTLKNGCNILITHGHILKGTDIKSITNLMNQYCYNNIKINHILIGHYHHAQIGDLISMGGCLCGGNSYTSSDLQFFTRASQNCYIVNDDYSLKGIRIDLQDVKDYKGYDLIEELEYYASLNPRYNNTVVITNLV